MPLTLYYASGSPPSRACLLLARYLKLDIQIKVVDLLGQEQHSEAFLKINPVHKIPVLVDDDFIVTESRAIMAYLINSKSPGSDLYPTDPKGRALVDQRLYYDATVVFEKLATLVRPGLYHGVKTVDPQHKKDIREVLKVLESFLEGEEFFAGKKMTIADISILASVSSFEAWGYNMSDYPNLKKWLARMDTLPSIEENRAGVKLLAEIMLSIYAGDTLC